MTESSSEKKKITLQKDTTKNKNEIEIMKLKTRK